MDGTPRLLAKSAAFLWRHPIVWLPVLAARTLDFLIWTACSAARLPAMKAVAPRSVLGGLSGRINGPVLLVGSLLSYLPIVCEVALFVYAMAVCARWADAIRAGEETASQRSWRVLGGPFARTAAVTLGVDAVTVLTGVYLTYRSGVPMQLLPAVGWCFLIAASWFVVPAWLRWVALAENRREREVPRMPPFVAVALGLIGYAVLVYLGAYLQQRLFLAHKIHGPAIPLLINFVASCLSSIPLAISFVAMARAVADGQGWATE